MGFHHVGLAGLKLLTLSDLSASASQGAGIIGMSYCTRPGIYLSKYKAFMLVISWYRRQESGLFLTNLEVY